MALSLIEDLRTDVVTKLKQKIDERASGIFASAAAPPTPGMCTTYDGYSSMSLRHLKQLKISYAIVIHATTGPEGGEAQGDSKPQSPFSAMLQAATRCV